MAVGVIRLDVVPRRQIATQVGGGADAKLLDGFRGEPPVDLEAVCAAIATIGALIAANPCIREIDVNPLVAGSDILALDALVIAKPEIN